MTWIAVPARSLKPGVAEQVRSEARRAVQEHGAQRLEDIVMAWCGVAEHVGQGTLDDGLIFDAVRVRLIEIEGGREGDLP
ncbi:MAG: hypothetical protein R2705_13805 [Ilumatobacteraceae bacterium]